MIPKIGFKYPKQRPEDEGSEPEVEDKSPSSDTTENNTSPPATNVDDEEPSDPPEGSKDGAARLDAKRELFNEMPEEEVDPLATKPSPKKGKKTISEKTAQRSNTTRKTQASALKEPQQVDSTTGGPGKDGNNLPPEGTEANAVTPARPVTTNVYD